MDRVCWNDSLCLLIEVTLTNWNFVCQLTQLPPPVISAFLIEAVTMERCLIFSIIKIPFPDKACDPFDVVPVKYGDTYPSLIL